jgi:peptidyl-prolyl cis-trans isomerase D
MLDWIPSVIVDRKNAQGLTDLTMTNVFKVNVNKLPAYAGVADSSKGYLLIKVISVDDVDAETLASATSEYNAALTSEYGAAYVATLKSKNKVSINQRLLMGDAVAQ